VDDLPRSEGLAVTLELALRLLVVVITITSAGAESLVDKALEVGKRLVVEDRHWEFKLCCNASTRKTEPFLYLEQTETRHCQKFLDSVGWKYPWDQTTSHKTGSFKNTRRTFWIFRTGEPKKKIREKEPRSNKRRRGSSRTVTILGPQGFITFILVELEA
jgi:hypothetical protein